jgi:catecholate siderophore receptor
VNRKERNNVPKINRVDGWPVTYRWAAMGTLLAYSALGVTKVAVARPWTDDQGKGGGPAGFQALVVRRFDIVPGNLGETLDVFARISGISVKFADEVLRTLPSRGLIGLYTPDQALKLLLADSGASYRFVAADAVAIQLAQVTTAVEVSADGPQMIGSPKYSELLRDTPQTISVIDDNTRQQQGVNTLRDALRNVAGISLAAGEGGAQGDNLTIRGFSGRNDIFLDGMRDFGSYYRDPFNYESVDVLQGPSSMAFGRGSTGGAVNQETKAPEAGKFISGSLQFGSDLTRRITADINEPLGQTSAFRFWMCWPLIVIATCSTAMSYQWANNLVYSLSGSPVPPANVAPRVTETQAMLKEDFKIDGWNALCALAEQKCRDGKRSRCGFPRKDRPT